jgi:hypothetical protein
MYLNGVGPQTLGKGSQAFNSFDTNLDCFRMGDRHTTPTQTPFFGDFFEVLFYETVLSAEDRQANEAELMTKWGIS